jgi:hypothetical protein
VTLTLAQSNVDLHVPPELVSELALESKKGCAHIKVSDERSLARPRRAQTTENTPSPPSAFTTGVRKLSRSQPEAMAARPPAWNPSDERWFEHFERWNRERSDCGSVGAKRNLPYARNCWS